MPASAGVQRKPRTLRDARPRLHSPRRHGLQREHLLPRARAHRHPVADRVADQVVHGAARRGAGLVTLDPDGAEGKKPATSGVVVTVWEKVDGAWRVMLDAGTENETKAEAAN
jgi:hypothetical protein